MTKASEAQKKAVKKYQSKCDAIMLRPTEDEGKLIRAEAEAAGKTVSGYILEAVRARMDKDNYRVKIPKDKIDLAAKEAGKEPKTYLAELIKELTK